MYVKSFNYPKKQVLKWQNTNKKGMWEIINVAKKISVKFPGTNIVLRPHPFEKIDSYTEALKDFSNIYVIKKGTVVEWIKNTKAVIQRNCSTSIKAGFLGVPALSPHYIPVFRSLPTSEAVSIKCENIKEIQKKIELILDNKLQIPKEIAKELKKIEEDWFYKIDGKSHQRIAEAIDNYLKRTKNTINKKEIEKVLSNYPKLTKKHILKQTIKNILNKRFQIYSGKQKLKDNFENYLNEWDKSDKMFDAESVNEILNSIKKSAKKNGLIPGIEKVKVVCSEDITDNLFGCEIKRSVIMVMN